ncbi:MAG TPA: hypothetical protein VIV15_13870 [Anaerolineales bacterium]
MNVIRMRSIIILSPAAIASILEASLEREALHQEIDMEMTMENTKIPENIEECRTGQVLAGGFVECLREGPNNCAYALPFGYCFLCQHPRLEEILQHTAEAQKTKA